MPRWASRPVAPALALAAGLAGLTLAGAPALAAMLGLGGAWLVWRSASVDIAHQRRWVAATLILVAAVALMAWQLDPVALATGGHGCGGKKRASLARLLLWFGWPAWPLAICRWPGAGASRLPAPSGTATCGVATVVLAGIGGRHHQHSPADRALLLGLPAMATLAAFALPTLSPAAAALIDWFTLLFFSISTLAIWVIWIAMQTGVPAKPAANVAKWRLGSAHRPAVRTAGGAGASAAWCSLVWWRASRDRAPILEERRGPPAALPWVGCCC